jgi:hypothetical protein
VNRKQRKPGETIASLETKAIPFEIIRMRYS